MASKSKSGIVLDENSCEFEFPGGEFDNADFADISEA